MKKLLLVAAAAAFMTSATQAQDVFKQTGGEKNLEVLFTPLGGSPIGINGIKFRTFTSASTALRVNLFVGLSSSTDVMLGVDDEGEEIELKDVSTDFSISLAPGIEKHFTGTDRLSPYVGAELLIGFATMTDKMDLDGTDGESTTTKDSNLNLGLNALAGVDFYFADDIYIGAELGFGFGFMTEFDTKTSSTVDGVDDTETPNGSSINLGPTVVGAIRAGFLF